MSEFFSPRNKNSDNNNNISPSSPTSSLLSSATATTEQIFNRFQTEAKSAFDKIQSEASELGDKVTSKIGPELENLKKLMTDQAERFKQEKLNMLDEFQKEKKRMIVAHLSKKLASAVNALMNIVVIKVKDALEDPYMPRWVKNMIDTLIDAVWPDIAEDIKEELFTLAHPKKPVDHGDSPCCFNQCPKSCCCVCPNPCCAPFPISIISKDDGNEASNCCVTCCCGLCYPKCFFECKDFTFFYGVLNWIRYTTCPYDRGFWRQMRDPAWWFLTIVAAIPKYGISQIYYLLWFLCFDKGDEFQLLTFIKSFKCLQFVSLGVLSAAIGGAQLFICSLPNPWLCPSYAPREELFTLILFISQIFLVWFAFCFLSSAQNKGGLYHQLNRAKEAKLREEASDAQSTLMTAMAQETVEEAFFESRVEDTEGRKRLYGLLIYDTIVFAICIGLAIFAAFFNFLDPSADVQNFGVVDSFWEAKNWKFVMTLYWIKTLYGLAAFPFLLLQLPLVSSLFSHSKPTGYNPFGNTVPFVGEEEKDSDEDDDDHEDKQRDKNIAATTSRLPWREKSTTMRSRRGGNNDHGDNSANRANAEAGEELLAKKNYQSNQQKPPQHPPVRIQTMIPESINNNNNNQQAASNDQSTSARPNASNTIPVLPFNAPEKSQQPQW